MANTILNALNCVGGNGNTGVGTCFLDIEAIVGGIMLPPGFKFSTANLASSAAFLTALKNACLAPVGSRIYPIQGLFQNAAADEGSIVDKYPNGSVGKVRDGRVDQTYQFTKGGFCLYSQLKKFDRSSPDWLWFDSTGLVFGLRNSDGTLSGAPLDMLDVPNPVFNDNAKATMYKVHIVAAPDFFSSFGYVQLAINDIKSVTGLNNATISSGGARVTNVSLVRISVDCAGTDLYAQYGSTLASASLWSVKDSVTGNVVAITSVATNATIGGYTITLNVSDANYNAGNPVNITLVDPVTLNAAGVANLSSNIFTTPN